MNKLKYAIILGILMIPNMLFAACEHGYFGAGKGTQENPYLVSTETDLEHIHQHLDRYNYYLQANDINLNKKSYATTNGIRLSGVYEGNNKSFINKYKGATYLFDTLEKNSTIQNLTIMGEERGIFLRWNEGTINNIKNKCNIISIDGQTASLVGNNWGGKILNCRNEGNIEGVIEGQYNSGLATGICIINNGDIEKTSNAGNISIKSKINGSTKTTAIIGGIVSTNNGNIIDCYNENINLYINDSNCTLILGGIAGQQYSMGKIKNSYSLKMDIYNNGKLSPNYNYPAIVNREVETYSGGSIESCYYPEMIENGVWDISKSGSSVKVIAKNDRGSTKSLDTYLKSSSFVKELNYSRYPVIWKQGDQEYPYPKLVGIIYLDFNSNHTKLGDNTLAQLLLDGSSNIDMIDVYNKTTGKSVYKGPFKYEILIDLPIGDNVLEVKACDSQGNPLVTANRTMLINKKNVLNEILNEINHSNGLEKNIIINGNERYFENNIENNLLITEIKNSEVPIFIIYEEVSPIFGQLLE